MPIYIKVEDYKEVKDTLNILKAKVSEAKRILKQLNEIRDKENLYLDDWAAKLNAAEKKIESISGVLG